MCLKPMERIHMAVWHASRVAGLPHDCRRKTSWLEPKLAGEDLARQKRKFVYSLAAQDGQAPRICDANISLSTGL